LYQKVIELETKCGQIENTKETYQLDNVPFAQTAAQKAVNLKLLRPFGINVETGIPEYDFSNDLLQVLNMLDKLGLIKKPE